MSEDLNLRLDRDDLAAALQAILAATENPLATRTEIHKTCLEAFTKIAVRRLNGDRVENNPTDEIPF